MEKKKILTPAWVKLLSQLLNPLEGDDRARLPRTCLVGIGNDLRGDDSAGLEVARALLGDERCRKSSDLLILEGGAAPENQTGKIRAFQPELILFVDAAQMDEPPGTVRWIPLTSIDGMSASSHSLPLSMLAQYITIEFDCDVAVLGIQPDQNGIGVDLTPLVRVAVNEIVYELKKQLNSVWSSHV
jgi:hydrogenase 3 maturation protease